jgi:hypothetical protein
VWVAGGPGAWHFVSLPVPDAERIRDGVDASRPGFGAVAVEATIGGTTWRTSVFPDAKRGTYVLPVKQAVRRAEHVAAGDVVTVRLLVRG